MGLDHFFLFYPVYSLNVSVLSMMPILPHWFFSFAYPQDGWRNQLTEIILTLSFTYSAVECFYHICLPWVHSSLFSRFHSLIHHFIYPPLVLLWCPPILHWSTFSISYPLTRPHSLIGRLREVPIITLTWQGNTSIEMSVYQGNIAL